MERFIIDLVGFAACLTLIYAVVIPKWRRFKRLMRRSDDHSEIKALISAYRKQK